MSRHSWSDWLPIAMTDIAEIVRRARTAKELSQAELGRRVGVTPQAIQAIEAGNVKKPRNIIRIAQVLGLDPNDLDADPNLTRPMTPIVGRAQAGNVSILANEDNDIIDEVDPPFGATSLTVGVEIVGDSGGGRVEDGDIVFYDDRREPVTEDLLNTLCVIGLADGRVVIKKPQIGSQPGLFHLISYNAEPMFDQPVIWAAKVKDIRPR